MTFTGKLIARLSFSQPNTVTLTTSIFSHNNVCGATVIISYHHHIQSTQGCVSMCFKIVWKSYVDIANKDCRSVIDSCK